MNSKGFGYFSSLPFWYSSYLPQRIQNLIIRDYASSLNIALAWSLPEMSNANSLYTFHQLLSDCQTNSCNHIISTSLLMHCSSNIHEILSSSQENNITFHFAIERISVTPNDDLSVSCKALNTIKLSSSWPSTLMN